MLFINATLSKNQLCKHNNQINKVPTSEMPTFKNQMRVKRELSEPASQLL